MTHREIARRLHCSDATVRLLERRALEKIALALGVTLPSAPAWMVIAMAHGHGERVRGPYRKKGKRRLACEKYTLSGRALANTSTRSRRA